MGTLGNEMQKVGYKLSGDEERKVHESLRTMKRKLKKTILCKKCNEPIKFAVEAGRTIPFDLDDVPHWQTCSYSGFTQKKAALDIVKKLGVLFIVKHGTDLEMEAGLSKKEVQILHAILEKIFREENEESEPSKGDADIAEVIQKNAEVSGDKLDNSIPFELKSCDPIGDPDEDRAPSEEAIKEAEQLEII